MRNHALHPQPDVALAQQLRAAGCASEAQIAKLIDVHLRAISTNDLEARMTKLEKDRVNSAAQDVAGGEIFR